MYSYLEEQVDNLNESLFYSPSGEGESFLEEKLSDELLNSPFSQMGKFHSFHQFSDPDLPL